MNTTTGTATTLSIKKFLILLQGNTVCLYKLVIASSNDMLFGLSLVVTRFT